MTDNKFTPDEIIDYIESFFDWNQGRGKVIRVSEYGGSMIVHFADKSKAKVNATIWQGEEVVLDDPTAYLKRSEKP